VRILLDTHTFLWWLENSSLLSARARDLIENGDNVVFLSSASGWEISIKAQLGKLKLPATPETFVTEQLFHHGFQSLSITMSHALHISNLPPLHRDPFDRLLIAQCQLEKIPIITADHLITQYKVESIW